MNSPFSSPARSRHRKPALLALLGALAAAALVVTPLMPAHASIDDATPVADAGTGSNTEIVITGVSEGLRLTGYLPPTAIVPDPAIPYPDSPPADYTSRSGFIGIITTASVDDPSSTGEMYCIAARTPTAVGIGYQSGAWSEANVPNIGYVTYILNNYYPAVEAAVGLTPDQQAAATQSAIWYFTDGLVLGAEDDVVRAATETIIAAAQANGPVTEPEAPVAISPASVSAPAGSAAGPYVVTAEGAAAVTVSVPTGYTMYSDAAATTQIPNASSVPSGTSIWITGPGATGVETVLKARATVTVQRGNIYLYDGNTPSYSTAQPMVLADTAQFDATATATTEFFSAGELTVNKAYAGGAVGQQGAAQLVIDCGEGYAFTQDIPAGTSTTQTYTFRGIPVGNTCTVTEPLTGATSEVGVTTDAPQTGTMAEAGLALTVTNTVELNPGSLNLVKVIDGTAAGQQSAISLSATCDNGLAETFDIPAGAVAGEYARTFGDLPAGTECTVAEQESGANSSVRVLADDPVTVTIAPGAVTEARLTNTVEPEQAAAGGTGSMSGGGVAPMPGGDAVPMPAGDALANTGGDAPMPLLGLAAGVIGLGALLMLAVRANRRTAE
ncbi:thioester domain-containing protein [Microbacterium sp. zg.Y625]|uniref:thioester domain-containing protein n=1 Tax=Microbacterium jiangjiandongii TaxID=3049071 RepID=UPI00214ADEA7|nr:MULTISPECIES: thioester domain-containing protein [unclassified Microbacterium]MCR2791827.1 thioester domain-containing protein [Microbacterium sp. zg.Y625]WIM24644.1 thioester domain-containing protein [Microbacterium sp. zg-Y625]